ncbi:NAD(P)H-binding protein [Kitasatospora sp. NPDC057904]|uniref:NAD(P)H-binding protein n=1 Tax=Kitasatospora sp. NPDC057904 TaxID=3346275 RepID=UPI0036DD7E86
MTQKRIDGSSDILVVGATGTVGRHVTLQLLASGVRVRALTRHPDLARQPRYVQGDLLDPDSLEAAATGADAAFLIWPYPTADGAAAAVAAMARHVRKAVFLSSAAVRDVPGRGSESPGRPDAAIEALIAGSGVRYTFLRPHGFTANTLRWAEEIRTDAAVRGFGGGAGLNLVDERDIAAVAVRALTEDGHEGARYVLTGPESPSQEEQVRIIGEAVGLPARWEELPRDAARLRMLTAGWPPAIVDRALDFIHARIGDPEPVTSTVEDITGRPPRSLRNWAADHAALFR